MNRKFVFAVIVIAIVGLSALGIGYITTLSPSQLGEPESVTVGNMLYEYSGLIFIAEDQDFFTANGLNITFKDYVSSVDSIKGLENKDTDITLAPEYAVVTEAFNRENISIIGNVDKYQSVFLIGRKDRGIKNISDLSGKKIGASAGTIGEFYLGRFLSLNGMPMKNVTLVPIPAPQYVDAITNGDVDAVVVLYKYLDESKERLGDRIVEWPIQNSQKGYVVLASRNDWIASHPDTIKRFLRSVKQAEEYSISHPAESQEIIRKRMNYSEATMAAIWPDHQYSLTLDQSLITAMEDESRWMISGNMTNATAIPDFLHYVDVKGLDTVKPEAVNIIGMARSP